MLDRSLGKNEAWHWISACHSPLNVVTSISFPHNINTEALTHSLVKLVELYPLLKATVIPDNPLPAYDLKDIARIPLIETMVTEEIDEALIHEHVDTSLNFRFSYEHGPLWRVIALTRKPGAVSHVVVCASHLIADGPSLNYLMANWLELLGISDRHDFPDTSRVVPEAMETRLPDKHRGINGLVKALGNEVGAMVGDAMDKPMRLSPAKEITFDQRVNQSHILTFNEQQTQSIENFVKDQSLTMESLIAATITKALTMVVDDFGSQAFALGSSVNCRPMLGASVQDNLGSYMLQMRIKVKNPADKSLLELAKIFYQLKREQLEQGVFWHGARLLEVIGPESVTKSHGFVSLLDKKGPGHISTNDLSLVHQQDWSKALNNLSAMTHVSLSVSGYIVCVIHLNPCLRLAFTYLEGIVPDHFIQHFFAQCRDLLTSNLASK